MPEHTTPDAAGAAVAEAVREEWGRLVSLLLARYRRLDLVEDALAEAVEAAVRTWPTEGVPRNRAGWLHRTASRRVLDRLRAEAMRRRVTTLEVQVEAARAAASHGDPGELLDPDRVPDDLLRLVMMCTHPALAPDAAAALALRLVLGVGTADIARLFLVEEATMAARITRAKRRIASAGIPFAVPSAESLPERCETVARIAYLAFTAGYAPGSGPDLLRPDLAGEAIRLVRIVRRSLPDEPVLVALLALMLLQHSRRDARVDAQGRLVLLADQDRALWRRDEIDEARELLRSPVLASPLPATAASFLLQAHIAAEHARAESAAGTRWGRIVEFYDALLTLDPTPAAALARAVAVAEDRGPEAGLVALASVSLPGSHRVDAVRAELLARAGDAPAALRSFDAAIASCANEAERDHLQRRRAELEP